ncbi:hypothetical protein [Parabacteroides goldsteinii]|nr:hypothetical protein [Parabacteroides goldsteinii]
MSCHIWARFDEVVYRQGGRKMSVSGLIENLALHHLERRVIKKFNQK